ncbi:hypothetical protein C8F04DRAFT_1109426 [Mycena alexandri]|uniref:Uncharacterized protein n=1 Tax=Mycena alexandri TaxID=1745969 RepID=A0AAD6SPI8_9AGAR|nr:hypothetical protein C8F04DRAFT_1109426 [Mycena alexandri]
MALQHGAEYKLLPDIPLEIQFLILDQLYTGRRPSRIANLTPLALTCLAWAGHIQSLLFCDITLNYSNTGAFLSLLRGNALPFARECSSWRISLRPLGSHRRWATVRVLSLRFCILYTAENLWAFIDLFPGLESLECSGWLYNLDDTSAAASDVARTTPTLHLKRLVLESSNKHSPQFISRQLAARDIVVDSLPVTLAAEADRDASPCNVLLSRIGPMLQVLTVTKLPKEVGPIIPLDISNCTALRHLTLHLRCNTANPMHMNTPLTSFIYQISTAPLTTLTLEIILAALSPLELQWQDVDAILTAYAFRGLENVTVRVKSAAKSSSTFGELTRHLQNRMAGLQQRGLLLVECGEL